MFYEDFIKDRTPDIRYLSDMKEVIFDQEWLRHQTENLELYYMYRDLGFGEKEKEKIHRNNLRYDITIIPPLTLGKEFVKTAGHYHSYFSVHLSYPEIYEVLSGEAYYLMQYLIENDSVRDVYFVYAAKGDKVIIPPNYGHFTINPGKDNLVMANWICRECTSSYQEVRKKGGACYFAFSEDGEVVWKANSNYKKIPSLRKLPPTNFRNFGLEKDKEMYSLVHDIEKLDFLVQPTKYRELWRRIVNAEV